MQCAHYCIIVGLMGHGEARQGGADYSQEISVEMKKKRDCFFVC